MDRDGGSCLGVFCMNVNNVQQLGGDRAPILDHSQEGVVGSRLTPGPEGLRA